LSNVIERLTPTLVGKDSRAFEAHVALLQALRAAAVAMR
jgi:hypothetical protein